MASHKGPTYLAKHIADHHCGSPTTPQYGEEHVAEFPWPAKANTQLNTTNHFQPSRIITPLNALPVRREPSDYYHLYNHRIRFRSIYPVQSKNQSKFRRSYGYFLRFSASNSSNVNSSTRALLCGVYALEPPTSGKDLNTLQ